MSSGSPIRLYGTNFIRSLYASGVLQAAVFMGVRIAPGAMLLTRMRYGATSWAMLFIISITPP
jgi:hypothetical protein